MTCVVALGALQYDLHDQMGGFSPPIFFGRLFLHTGKLAEKGTID
jgi:hypothetical protein